MKKIISSIVVFVLAMVFIVPGINAKEIKTLDLKEKTGGVVTVSGTTEDDMLAVAIVVYDKDSKLVTMQTTDVDSNKFSYTVKLAAGKYTIKVADYDGGEYKTSTIDVKGNLLNPNTLDDIYVYIALVLIAIAGIVYYCISSRKNKK